jgi:DNA-3-methyladenine glycosylase
MQAQLPWPEAVPVTPPFGDVVIKPADPEFFAQDVSALARALVGCLLLVDGVGGVIVETESYDAADAASHSFLGPTPRNAPMFGPPGRAYVYRIYGAHWCFNIVGGLQPGAAVLIRALEPTHGATRMRERRGLIDAQRLCAGPGRLCQALGLDGRHNGLPVTTPPFALVRGEAQPLVSGSRIGISKETTRPWRFGLAGSPYLSRRFPDEGG